MFHTQIRPHCNSQLRCVDCFQLKGGDDWVFEIEITRWLLREPRYCSADQRAWVGLWCSGGPSNVRPPIPKEMQNWICESQRTLLFSDQRGSRLFETNRNRKSKKSWWDSQRSQSIFNKLCSRLRHALGTTRKLERSWHEIYPREPESIQSTLSRFVSKRNAQSNLTRS